MTLIIFQKLWLITNFFRLLTYLDHFLLCENFFGKKYGSVFEKKKIIARTDLIVTETKKNGISILIFKSKESKEF